MSDAEKVIQAAESQMGSPYVYGTWGQACTTALRKRYANYNPSQKAITYKRCAVLNGSQKTCSGCKYEGRLAFDCRGFTNWCMKQAGISITGGYVGRQWTDDNWAEKGDIAVMPDLVCCVFVKKSGNWSHTGLHVGGGRIIHCSGEVKEDTVGGNNWTHYGIPKGLYTDEEIRKAHEEKGVVFVRIMKQGMRGEDVREVQRMLNELGYDCGKADGCFGQNTLSAVQAFQKDNGLTADGIVGLKTWNAMKAASADADPDEPDDPVDPDTPTGVVALTEEEARKIISQLESALAILRGAMP